MATRQWHKTTITDNSGEVREAVAPIIISASRATDLPAFYPEWLVNRLDAGYMKWTNPFNRSKPQYVSFSNTRVIVFWTKNPAPLIPYLPTIDSLGINYYFQFTLNDYTRENLEPCVPPLEDRIDTFRHLSTLLGPERIIWRFDPILFLDSTPEHVIIERISHLATILSQYTRKLVFSFADIEQYKAVCTRLRKNGIVWQPATAERISFFIDALVSALAPSGLTLHTCAEDISSPLVQPNRCIDDQLMIRLWSHDSKLMNFLGYSPSLFDEIAHDPQLKDKGQRSACGCIISKDIGSYSTCPHSCLYCYANNQPGTITRNHNSHDSKAESIV